MTGGSGPTTDEMKAEAEERSDDEPEYRRFFAEVQETVECVRRVRYEFTARNKDEAVDTIRQISRGYPPDGIDEDRGELEQVGVMHQSVIKGGEVEVPGAD